MTKAELFLELAKPDEKGFSRKVFITEFVEKYAELQLGNGGSWCRDDGTLGTKYNIERHKEKGRIVYVKLHGHKKLPIKKPIPSWIRKKIESMKCVMLFTSGVEIDHKDGRRDDPRLTDATKVTLDDFQPLSKAANVAKRQHCKRCRKTDKRFDATALGFSVAQVKGDEIYRGTCEGCYWYDPVAFRNELGK